MSTTSNRIFGSLSAGIAVAGLLLTATQGFAAGNDPNAGSWQMIVLTSPTQINVSAPSAVTSAQFQADISALKAGQAALSKKQRQTIDYWNKGGVLNWNQIEIGLVAATDLPPEPNADGTYSAPSAATPFAFPQFPFSNPPYAARSYSYVSVAVYEALKVAWYYKYLYNRPSPMNADKAVQALSPASDLPGYPSEDGVVAGVNQAMLAVLFPTWVDLVNQKVAEHQQAAILSGRATKEDMDAGIAIGKAVAAIFLARAGNDGLKAAGGNQAQWDALAAAAVAKGQIPWRSMESPARPPMLPFFGNVQMWMMTKADLEKERPGPPPPTGSAAMAKELADVKAAARNITRSQAAISYKWADGASSPTPPGHWNLIADGYLETADFSEVRTARALALLNMAMHDAAVTCWDTKYFYFNPRPAQLDPSLKTQIALPNFPAYESGHSVFSAAAATVLSYLFPSGSAAFNAQMEEAAISRFYSGIHFKADIEVGKTHGKAVGGYTVRFGQRDGGDAIQ